MALQLRRGLNSERTGETFAAGELVYTTDTKQLYVGDGTTTGGILVSNSVASSPSQLTQNLNLNGFNISGTGNITATAFVGDGSGLTNLPNTGGSGTGVIEGQEYAIDIQGSVRGDDTTVIVDSVLGRVSADLYGDGSNITNITLDQLSDVDTTGIATNSILKYDGANWVIGTDDASGTFTVKDEGVALSGAATSFDFVGDGVTVSGVGSEKTITIPGGSGGTGIVEGQTYRIDINGDIIADDSTIMVNSFNNTITASAGFFGDLVGNVTGDVVGSLKGSIFGDDSSIVYDSAADSLSVFRAEMSILTTREINPETGFTAVTLAPTSGGTDNKLILSAIDSVPTFDIQLESSSDLSASDNFVGAINFKIDDSNPSLSYGGINMRKSRLTFVNDASGSYADSKSMVLADGQVGIGTVSPSATLDVQGDISATGVISTTANVSFGRLNSYTTNQEPLFGSSVGTTGGSYLTAATVKLQHTRNYVGTETIAGMFAVAESGTTYNAGTERNAGSILLNTTAASGNLPTDADWVFETLAGSSLATALTLSGTNATIGGSLFVSTIDTDDSSAITITPAVVMSSDLSVENHLIVTGTVTADKFVATGTETPEISASANLNLTAGNAVVITGSPLRMASFTTTERDALAAQNGDVIYNTTDNKFQGYENGAWANLI